MMKEKFATYFKQYVNLISVMDFHSDLTGNELFFEEVEKNHNFPGTFYTNLVADKDTTYYKRFTEKDKEHFFKELGILKQKYFKRKTEEQKCGSYLNSIVGVSQLSINLRERVYDQRNLLIPFSGACIPCLLYTSPSPRDRQKSRMPSSA
eukprot:TRINITY_DN17040_c0_g1_i1.p3 TRINITY_DN17040_c0_g1~~TRINITY_DN17040_c0_g1_i1.p3  ORF type:complete len:150 (+),score=23.34 TRINITY_DN17040_c0_g1_i1:1103-1552(+)